MSCERFLQRSVEIQMDQSRRQSSIILLVTLDRKSRNRGAYHETQVVAERIVHLDGCKRRTGHSMYFRRKQMNTLQLSKSRSTSNLPSMMHKQLTKMWCNCSCKESTHGTFCTVDNIHKVRTYGSTTKWRVHTWMFLCLYLWRNRSLQIFEEE